MKVWKVTFIRNGQMLFKLVQSFNWYNVLSDCMAQGINEFEIIKIEQEAQPGDH